MEHLGEPTAAVAAGPLFLAPRDEARPSGGLPGRLHEACGIAARKRNTDLTTVRTAFKHGWDDAILPFWGAPLTGDRRVMAEVMFRWRVSCAEATRWVQALLCGHFYGGIGRGARIATFDLALCHLNGRRLEELGAVALAQARREGVGIGLVWT